MNLHRLCGWILVSWKHNNRHWQLWQGSQNMYQQSKFSLQETRWYMAPETSRTSNQNSALRVTGVGHIAILCRNVTSHRSKQEASWSFHHNCLRRMQNISWKDKVKNECVRRKTNQSLLECTLQKRRLRWFGRAAYGKCQSH